MKILQSIVFLLVVAFSMTACQNDSIDPNPNKASLEYNGILIDFDDIKIEDYPLELDAGNGPRALGTRTMEDINGFNYYILLDYKKDSTGNYQFHKINLGFKEKLGPMHYYNKVFFASLTEGYNVTDFKYTITTDGLKVKGTFSGRLRSITEGEIEIKNGTFGLDFTTMRNY